MTQAQALSILKTGANVFLTGEPGSGKTHTINEYVAYLRGCGIEPAVTASTGIAATHIGGYTIHSWSGIGVKNELSKYDIDRISQNRRVVRRVANARVLIIDEISMLSAKTLSMVEAVCREIRRSHLPFGGLQVILVGDFFQLPPVVQNKNESDFAFVGAVWQKFNPLVCYLSEQHRQEDANFLELLLAIRGASFSEKHLNLLRAQYASIPHGNTTQLYSHNADVNAINDTELSKLAGKNEIFEMRGWGPEKLVTALKNGCLSPEILSLKIGARVMFTKNDTVKHRFVNGTLGVVVGFTKTDHCPIVKTNSDKSIFAEPMGWRLEDGGRVLAEISQVPLRLAWAMTVHKSQGMSLDAAHMDLSGAFEYGQGYVALSRVRSLAGLSLAGFNKQALCVHPKVIEKDVEFQELSKKAHDIFSKITDSELETMHKNFVRACGGKSKKEERWQYTLDMLRSGKTIEEIANLRGRTIGTILDHLEKLYLLEKLNMEDIVHLSLGKEQEIIKIREAFQKIGVERLKPVFEFLGGRVSYEIIRLARILFVINKKTTF